MLTDHSLHSNALARWDDTSTFDFHRLQAIKAINKRLNIEGKSPSVPISDGITMAVALLVNNEVSSVLVAPKYAFSTTDHRKSRLSLDPLKQRQHT